MTTGVIRFAWQELLASLCFWKRTGSPLQNDFITLSCCFFFSFLLVSLGALIELNGTAVLERVLLGGVPGKGVPVYFRTSSALRVMGLDEPTLRAFNDSKLGRGLGVYPTRPFDLLDATELQMPGRVMQQGDQSSDDLAKEAVYPQALAISRESPLWQDLMAIDGRVRGASDGPELEVIASLAAFNAMGPKFYSHYRSSAMKATPDVCPLRHHLPESIIRWDDLASLLLAEPMRGGRRFLHPFKVRWVDSFPTPQDYALIVPLEIFDLLKAIENNNEVRVFIEGGGRSVQRVEGASLMNAASDRRGVEEFRTLARCLGAQRTLQNAWNETWSIGNVCGSFTADIKKTDDVSATLNIKIDRPIAQSTFDACAKRSGISTAMESAGRAADFKPSLIRSPMTMAWHPSGNVRACKSSAGKECTPHPEMKGDEPIQMLGKPNAVIFVPTGRGVEPLETVAKAIERWELNEKVPEVFTLDPASRATLIRYSVLRKFIDSFGVSLAWTALFAFAMFTGAVLGLMFGHRKIQYGVIMLHGVGAREIAAIALLQTAIVLCLAAVAGFAFAYFIQELIYLRFNQLDVVQEARRTIGLGHLRLLLPGLSTLLGCFSVVAGTALAVLIGLRWWNLRSIQSASQLLRQ